MCDDGRVDTKWDLDFSFDVGTSEVHHVTFHWRQWWGEAIIDVDGIQVLRERNPFALQSLRQFEVFVGSLEGHHVVIEKHKHRALGGLRRQSFRVLVDGDLLEEH